MLPLLPGAIELAQEGKMLLMTLTMMITAGAGRAAGQQGCSGKLVAAHQVSARSSRTSRRFLHTSSISNNHHHVSSPCTSPGVSPPGHPPPPHYCPRSQLRIHPRNSRCPRSHHRSWPSSGCTPPSWFPSCPVPCKPKACFRHQEALLEGSARCRDCRYELSSVPPTVQLHLRIHPYLFNCSYGSHPLSLSRAGKACNVILDLIGTLQDAIEAFPALPKALFPPKPSSRPITHSSSID
jgi:hypothetical protein